MKTKLKDCTGCVSCKSGIFKEFAFFGYCECPKEEKLIGEMCGMFCIDIHYINIILLILNKDIN